MEILVLQPIVALVAGILILIVPHLLNYIVAIYLILIGLVGLLMGKNQRSRAGLDRTGGYRPNPVPEESAGLMARKLKAAFSGSNKRMASYSCTMKPVAPPAKTRLNCSDQFLPQKTQTLAPLAACLLGCHFNPGSRLSAALRRRLPTWRSPRARWPAEPPGA